MNRILNFALLISMLCFYSCAKDEVELTASISGYVTDYASANTPIAGASVTINSKGLTKTTGSDGRYKFRDVESGTYTIQVTADGYQTTTKQTTVYAGEDINLDFQLTPASQNVEVTPQMLSFGPQNDKLSFTIKNKGTQSMQYSITDYPSYITVSPSSGQVAAMGTQTVSVNVDRDALTEDVACQLIVNIGNDSYPINISVNSQEVSQKMSVTPSLLDFGTNYSELQFTIKNIGTAGDLSWNISTPTKSYVSVVPSTGVTSMGKSTQVTVKVDRDKMTEDLQSFIIVNIPGGSASVQIVGKKDSSDGGDDETGDGEIVVKSNLLAYYTFDEGNMFDSYENQMHGQLYNEPTFIDDTPSGKGKALFLNSTKDQYANIPYKPFAGRTAFTINLWIKDFGNGYIYSSKNVNGGYVAPSLFASENGIFQFRVSSLSYDNSVNYTYKYSMMQDGKWHMLTVVAKSDKMVDLYVDGLKVDTGGYTVVMHADGTGIRFGGASSMKIDNVRFYGTNLTSDEILEIYNSEK